MRKLGEAEEEALDTIREVFTGTSLMQDQAKVSRILQVRAEIQKEWSDARDSFLAIGRALLSLEDSLTRTEWQRLRQSSEKLFPFSEATATQLRQIARAVDSGRLPREQCPGSYGTAYQITLLSDAQLQAAQQRGLIRPDVTRREIMELRQETRLLADTAVPKGRIDRTALREERRRLLERRDALKASLAQVEVRLQQIERLFGAEAD
jgi:exonuclease VII small subunit